MKPRTILKRTTAILMLALFVGGCSQLPTDPTMTTSASSQAGAMRMSPSNQDELDANVGPKPGTVESASASRLIYPLQGGTVAAGQFRVIVPPGALRTRAVVSVKQADLTKREVELEVTPASANGFLVPVLLVADCSDMDARLLSIQTIYWWNPAEARWDAVLGAQVNLLGKSVSVPLWHFSKYKVDGKAGW